MENRVSKQTAVILSGSPSSRVSAGLLGALLAGAMLWWVHSGAAQKGPADAVEQLRTTLKAPARDLAERERRIRSALTGLQSLGSMRRALALQDWRDTDLEPRLAKVDSTQRAALVERFSRTVRELLRNGSAQDCLAVVNLLGEMGPTLRDMGSKHGLASSFAPDLALVIKQRPSPVRDAATTAMGRINPEPSIAIPAIAQLLAEPETAKHMTAAEALFALVRTVMELPAPGQSTTGIEVTRREIVAVAQAVTPVAARGLRDGDPQVRTRCMQAIGLAATALRDTIREPSPPDNPADMAVYKQQVDTERQELQPLMMALRDLGPALAAALSDADSDVRWQARRALEDMAKARSLLHVRMASTQPRSTDETQVRMAIFPAPRNAAEDPLGQGIRATVPTLLAGMADADVRVRRMAVEFLETLEPDTAGVNRALAMALRDPDRSVRWTAARTLGKLPPLDPGATVPELVRLLTDSDLDLELCAARALQNYGTVAEGALPALLQAADVKDAEMRVAALRTLEATNPGNPQLLVKLRTALADEDARVRQGAAEILGRFGPSGREAEPALRELLGDRHPDVRKAANDALANLAQQRPK